MTEFELLVKEMRDTQKEYFRTRDKETLKKSKGLEQKVDKELSIRSCQVHTNYDKSDQQALF